MALHPILTDAATRREQIREKALEGLKAAFPLQLRDHTLELHDLAVQHRDFGPQDQKDALLQGTTLHEPVKGTVVMKDGSGKVVETAKNVTLLHLPYFTERHTFIVGGNEYQVSNQIRMKPGVYTRRRANDEVEAAFNLSKGTNFRLSIDPKKGHPYMEYGTTLIPLYPVLRGLGVPHTEIAQHWGDEVAAANRKEFEAKETTAIDKLYGKLVHPSKQFAKTTDAKVEEIKKLYNNTAMDPEVNEETLGEKHDKVSPLAMMHASKKLLNVYRSGDDVDDRDSLAFKTFHGVEDFIKERIGLDARTIALKVKSRATSKTTLREILPSAPFSSGVRSFITTSQLSAIPTQINPMETIDHAVKVTSLGEGGISSERAIPMEARQLHSTHLGILDPVRTPESFKAGVDIRASLLAHRDEKGNLYTLVKDVKKGDYVYLSAKELSRSVIAFENQPLTGIVDAMDHGEVAHVPADKVQYQLVSAAQKFSPTTNLIPMIESIQGNRATMGSKMQTQSLPLVDREAPLVQVGTQRIDEHGKAHETSFETEFGKLINPTAPVSGKIVKIDSQYIYIDPHGTKKAEEFEKVAGEVKRQKTIKGITFKIELEPGDKRTGTDENGKKWEKGMSAAYGHIPKTRGDDGETVDVYLKEKDGDYLEVFVIHQNKKDGTHDEDKCMVGWDSRDAAKEAYLAHVPEWCYGSMTSYPWDEFKDEYLEERKKESAEKSEKGLIKVPYETNYPFASKTYLTHDLNVKVGDHVKEDQVLGESNFTKDGVLALGKNMKVGYMAYYGLNSNDAVVISDGAAKKLTSEHMYKEIMDVGPDTTLSKEAHRVHFGSAYTAAQYNNISEDGVIKKGAKVLPHDPLIVGVRKAKQSAADALLGNLRKALASPYKEEIRTWDHDFEGEVVDVFRSDKRVVVTVRTREPMRVGDKLAGRYGNKGVVSQIVPDSQMIQDEKGEPVDILYTSAGIISRINPAQVLETGLAKVAQKTGKPFVVESFSGRDNVKWVSDLLKEHGVKDKETVFDPRSGRHIPGVMVGPQYTFRLFKTTDSNFAARGTGGYDVNLQPTKGGEEGAKAIGKMEFNALVAHNARNVLREASTIKSEKNDEFWRAVQLGLPLPPLKESFVHNKLMSMLTASGIHLERKGSVTTLMPLTDARTTALSAGAIENAKLVRAKDLKPERGGFFDPAITGGDKGTRWAHIDLAEPLVNPVFAEPTRRLLGLTGKEFEKLQHEVGGETIKRKLAQIDIPGRLKDLRNDVKKLSGSKLDDAIKQIKYLEALQRAGLTPASYVISKIPVIPPIMRPIVAGQGGAEMVVGDANHLYNNLFLHNEMLQQQNKDKLLPPAEHAQLRKNLLNSVGATFGTEETDNPKLEKRNVKGFLVHITGKTTPKSSFFQKKILKRNQDISGRGTAAPDANLGMDEIGLPEEMLWSMFEKFIIARLVRRGFGAVQAKEMVEERHPAARDALLAECKERPVMVNRAPTLHRYNIVGAYATPTPGKTIRVNPFIEKGMNLDYDGDTLQVHAPVLPGSVNDVKQMTLSHLLFGDKSRDELMVAPSMEAILGVHLASKKKVDGKVHKFKTKADAVAAYHAGDISLDDQVEITG